MESAEIENEIDRGKPVAVKICALVILLILAALYVYIVTYRPGYTETIHTQLDVIHKFLRNNTSFTYDYSSN